MEQEHTISMEKFCAALYCAYTPSYPFAVGPDGRIVFTAESQSGTARATYRVQFDAVRNFTWTSETALAEVQEDPDYRWELSIIELECIDGGWRVWFNPWYAHEVEFQCSRIRINGAAVVGSGRWLQDDPPSSLPDIPGSATRVV